MELDADRPRLDYRRPVWHATAPCIGKVALFFSDSYADKRAAIAMCSACPAADQCREEGDQLEPRTLLVGIRSGETPTQRARRRRERPAVAA